MSRRTSPVIPGFGLTLGYTLVYLSLLVLIPLGALFLKTTELSWAQFIAIVSAPRVLAALKLSFGTAFAAAVLNGVIGTLLAWVLVRYRFPGRKIIVDSYGGMARHGGGAFSGKDPSKVDRSAAYAGRYVAKNIVAAGLADRCEIQVSYAIGVAQPTSISINTFGTHKIAEDKIIQLVREVFDLRPYAITRMLDLLHPMYQATAAYGHFGRTPQQKTVGDDSFTTFSWEQTNKVEALRAAAGL